MGLGDWELVIGLAFFLTRCIPCGTLGGVSCINLKGE